MTSSSFEKTPLSNKTGSGGEVNLTEKQCQDLKEGLTNLPEEHAKVMVLHYLQDVSLAEIATRLKLEPAVVDQLHYEALTRLRHSAK